VCSLPPRGLPEKKGKEEGVPPGRAWGEPGRAVGGPLGGDSGSGTPRWGWE